MVEPSVGIFFRVVVFEVPPGANEGFGLSFAMLARPFFDTESRTGSKRNLCAPKRAVARTLEILDSRDELLNGDDDADTSG